MAQAVPFIIAAASAAQVVVGYMAARQEAKALEANAKAVEEQGKYNAAIERNNAQAQKQQQDFERAVVLANRRRALEEADREAARFERKTRQELAGFDVKFGYGGTFNSYMDSLENDAFAKQLSMSAQISDESLSAYLQANEHTRMGKLYTQRGETNARNILFGAQNQSMNLKNQASATKTAGIANVFGGIAGGVAGTSSALQTNKKANIKSFGFS